MANGIQLIPGSQRNAFVAQGINNFLAGILQQAQTEQFRKDLPTILNLAQKAQAGQQILPQDFAQIKSPQALQILSSGLTAMIKPQREISAGGQIYDPRTQTWITPPPTKLQAAQTEAAKELAHERESTGKLINMLNIPAAGGAAAPGGPGIPAIPGYEVGVRAGPFTLTPEKATETEKKEIRGYNDLLDYINRIEPMLEESKQYIGPLAGYLTEARGKWGETPIIGPLLGGIPPEKVIELFALVRDATDIIARLRTGAQINAQEEQLYKNLISPLNKSYTEAKTDLATFKKSIQRKLDLREGITKREPLQIKSEEKRVISAEKLKMITSDQKDKALAQAIKELGYSDEEILNDPKKQDEVAARATEILKGQ